MLGREKVHVRPARGETNTKSLCLNVNKFIKCCIFQYIEKINTQIQKASLTNLLFKRTDVPPVQSENIQEASGIQDIFLSRLITGQSCQRGNTDVIHVRNIKHKKKNICLLHFNIAAWCYIPLRSCSSVVDSWLSLHDWTAGEPANFSSHLMKDGHDANP